MTKDANKTTFSCCRLSYKSKPNKLKINIMKKIYAILFLLALSTGLLAQTFVTEDFSSGTMPPGNWTIDNLPGQWENSATANAGGTSPEAKFTWTNGNNYSRLVSPAVDLTGFESVALRFKHYLDNYGGGNYSIGVATTSGGGDWNIVWQEFPNNHVGPEELLITIDNDDVGASDFQFCFVIEGNLYNLNYWYIDNIVLFSPYPLDAEMQAITTYPFVAGPTAVEGTIINNGTTNISSLEVSWQVGTGDIYTTEFTGLDLDIGDAFSYTCDDLFDFPIGNYDLSVWVASVNGVMDDNPDNDLLSKNISVVSHIVDRKPLFEEFTSSTCAPCASFNTGFVPWCEDHADDITLVKYQMNWPGSGDPYYTAEGGDRRNYYGVTWVPWLVGNGEFVNTDMGAVNSFYDGAITVPGFASFVASRTTVSRSTVMDIDVNILPFANFSDFKLHIVVFENLTTGNVASNGETEFEHVMMKMVPDASGTTINLVDREPITISESIDLAGTNIEEWDDLGVAIIIQDHASAEVMQSGYALENGVFASDADLAELNMDGTMIEGFEPDILEYNIELPEGTTEIPEISAVAEDENATVIVVPAIELPGTTTVDVFAEDLVTHNQYIVNFTVLTDFVENAASKVKVYPNPTTGLLTISGVDNAQVAVYSITGNLIYESESAEKVDLSNQPDGVYLIRIIGETFVSTKRVTLSR